MKSTITDLKDLTHLSTTVEEGIHKEVYRTPLLYHGQSIDRGDINRRVWGLGEDLLDSHIAILKRNGANVSDEYADFDLWPSLGENGENGTLIIVLVAITEDGRATMRDEIEA